MLVEEVSMKTLLRLVVLCLAAPAGVVLAQDKATQEKPMVSQDPLSTWNKFAYARVKDMLLKSAEKMDIEHTKTSKADLIAALNTAFAYCDKAYGGMTDATAVQTIKLFGNDAPRLSALTVNNMHDLEHYGNLATYMRMKSIVPPSSEQQQAPAQPAKK